MFEYPLGQLLRVHSQFNGRTLWRKGHIRYPFTYVLNSAVEVVRLNIQAAIPRGVTITLPIRMRFLTLDLAPILVDTQPEEQWASINGNQSLMSTGDANIH